MRPRGMILALLVPVMLTIGAPARADIAPDEHGRVATLPATTGAHWVWGTPSRLTSE